MSKKHIHKYIFPPPNGPTSIGKCKCGAKQEAHNSIFGVYRFNNSAYTSEQRKKRALKNFVKK